MIKSYISNKNYSALYINTIGIKFASALVLTFVGAHLYTLGLSLSLLFLYFGAEFFLRGLLTPLGGSIVSKYGFKKAIIAANIVLALYFIALGMYETWPLIGFMSFILHALSRAIYYPAKHYIQAKFVQEFNRGRFLTLEIVIGSLTGSLALLAATYSVTVLHTFWPIVVLTGILLIISSLAILFVLGKLDRERNITYSGIIKYSLSKEFRKDLVGFSGFGVNIAFNNVVVAMLVFFAIESLKLFGILMASILIIEMLITLIFGRLIDANRLKSNQRATSLQILSYLSFFFIFTPFLTTVIKTAYNMIWNLFDSSFTARFHSKISKKGLIYACSKELTMDMAAAFVCVILSLLAATLSHNIVFTVSLLLAASGAFIAQSKFQD